MGTTTEYFRSQIGEASVIDYSHTDFPWKLFVKDVYYFFVYIWALPWIVWPMYPFGSKEFDELYPTPQNLFCVLVHLVLAILQLAFILALPFSVVLPVWMAAAGIAGFMVLNSLLCKLLNGSKDTYNSDEKYAKALPEHEHEQWIFLNGVAVGYVFWTPYLISILTTFTESIGCRRI